MKDGYDPAKSVAYSEAPWIKHPIPMWRKTPLRAGQKWLPKSAELAVAIGLDEAGETGRVRFDHVLDAEAVSGGAWEVPEHQVDPDEMLPSYEPTSRPTQVQVQTAQQPGDETQQTRAPAQRKAPAKRAVAPEAPQDDGPPDDRWPPETDAWTPPGTTQAATAANQAPVADSPSAAVEPAPEGAVLPTPSGGQAFEAWLLDENGDPSLDEPFIDPVLYARELHRLWSKSAVPENILHQNADGIEDAQEVSVEAARIIATLHPLAAEAAEEAEPEAPVIVVPLAMDRGKPAVGPYLTAFRKAVADLTETSYLDFIAANMETLQMIPLSTRSLCLKALVERAKAIGVQVPPSLAASLNPAPQPAQRDSEVRDADYERDKQQAENQIATINACANGHELEQWRNGVIATALGGRFQREGKTDLFNAMKAAFDAKKASFKGPSL
jgi:hypothetical protein